MIKRVGKSDSKSRTKARKFQYTKRSPAEVKARATAQSSFDSIWKSAVPSWKPGEGDHYVRFLPPTWDGADHYGYDIWIHRFVGPNQSSVLCPRRMLNKPCPICEAAELAEKEGEQDEAKALRPVKQVAVYMLDQDKKGAPEVTLWTMPSSVDRDVAKICTNSRSGEVIYIDDPFEGYNFSFSRQGTALNTRYIGFVIDRSSSPACESSEQLDKILDFIQENPIPDSAVFKTYDELRAVLEGDIDEEVDESVDEDDEDEDDEDSSPKKKSSSKKKRPVEDDDDEDEDEDEDGEDEDGDDEDEDEEPAPKKPVKKATTSKKRNVKDEDEDDDEDEDGDDEDEDEEPAPNKKAAKKKRPVEDEDDDDEDEDYEDEDDEDEDEEPAPKKPVKKATTSKKRRK